jgi:osmotically inducible protein OsmC
MDLEVRASVPKIDDATFQKIARDTKENCPVSKALKGNLELSLTATLSS